MSMSQNDRRTLDIMESTPKISNGHYEVALPWKKNHQACKITSLKQSKDCTHAPAKETPTEGCNSERKISRFHG